ncbi:hypothetical protein [Herminiimonas sp.]|nr:hypothetical protein [Herminiimonas sp.]MDO8305208.1 hypothetical protein [Herminiimonas sp.]
MNGAIISLNTWKRPAAMIEVPNEKGKYLRPGIGEKPNVLLA